MLCLQLDGIAAAEDDDTGVFGAARALLEQELERQEAGGASTAAAVSPAPGQYEQLLQALSAAAASTQVCILGKMVCHAWSDWHDPLLASHYSGWAHESRCCHCPNLLAGSTLCSSASPACRSACRCTGTAQLCQQPGELL